MKKKKYVAGMAALVCISLVINPFNVLADNHSTDFKKQQNKINQQKAQLAENIDYKKSEVEAIDGKQQSVAKQLEMVIENINKTNDKLKAQSTKVSKEKAKIRKLQEEIERLKKELKERQKILERRARAVQVNSNNQGYLSVILQSEDFGDFIDRANLITQLVSADQEILQQQQNDQKAMHNKQNDSQEKLTELNHLVSEIAVAKNNLESQKVEKNDLIVALAEKKDKTIQERQILEREQSTLSVEEKQVTADIIKAKQKEREQKEMAAKQVIEREKQTASAQQKKPKAESVYKQQPTQETVSSFIPTENRPAQANNGGMFIKPAAGMLTSGFSDRINPVTGEREVHKGQDISTGGTITVSAAATGKVIFAGYGAPGSGYGGYGYVVKIDHGNGYQTLYGHMRAGSLQVTAGQQVIQGQTIGIMGSTGQSTGQHLHFEIHQNDVPIDPANYL